MTGAEIMAVVGFFVTLFLAALTVWKYIDSKIGAVNNRVDAAAAIAALARSELATYQTHVAETYVSKAGLSEQTSQIMGAISAVKQAVDGMTMRIDRVVENQHPPKVTRSRAT